MKRFYNWLFAGPMDNGSAWDIIRWWEARRIPYNLVVGATGVLSLALFLFFINSANVLTPGEDAVEPIALVVAPVIINICYTVGWVVELILKSIFGYRPRTGPFLLKVGMGFSLLVIFFPSVFWGLYLAWKVLHKLIVR